MNTKILSVICMMFFLIGIVSAFEFDNVKSYDAITREVTIHNTFLGFKTSEVGKARLNTPLNVKVGLGYQKVAEFDLWAYEDYSNALKQFTFTDLKKKEKINREFDLKYKTTKIIDVDDYDNVYVRTMENGTIIYNWEKVGTHEEEIEDWVKITPANLKKKEVLTIGIFTEVKEGDFIDWIPTIYGVEVKEWASWEASLNTGLISYYRFENDVTDALGTNDLTDSGTADITGKVGRARHFTRSESDKLSDATFSGLVTGNGARSVCSWINIDTHTDGNDWWFGYGTNTATRIWTIGHSVTPSPITNLYANDVNIADTLSDDTWYFICLTHDGTNTRHWLNGLNKANATNTLNTNTGTLYIGSNYEGLDYWDGDIDELGYWSRALSYDEIQILYNNGDGMYVNFTDDNAPTITLNSPLTDANYTTPQSITFNYTAYDDVNLTDVKLYVNTILNQTNASGINATDYLFDLSLGDGDYTIYGKATDSASAETDSASVRIVINTVPFIEFLTPPTLVDHANITQEYIPMKINTTTALFQNITYYLENINGTSYSQYYATQTYDINFTNMPDAHYHYNVTICATSGKCNTTETRHINHDTIAPYVVGTNLTNITTFSLPINSTWEFNASDEHLSTCFYNATNHTTTVVSCNSTINTTWASGGAKVINIYANDTFGNINSATYNVFINYIQAVATYEALVIEAESHAVVLSLTASAISSFNGTLHYRGVDYAPTISNNGTLGVLTSTLTAPLVNANELVYFNWTYILNGVSYNSSAYNHTIATLSPINVTSADCSEKALRFNIENEINQSALSGDIEYNIKYGLSNDTLKTIYGSIDGVSTFYFCINSTLSQYYNISYGEIQYRDEGFVDRRYYLFSDQTISNNTLTNHTLRDLETTAQTSFLLTMEDTSLNVYSEKYTALWRWYPDFNEYRIVEMGKTDENGQTVAHIDTEDVDYRIGLYETDGTLIKLGEPLRFICSSAPCSFTLRVGATNIDYSSIFDVQAELTYNDTTSMFYFIYSDPNQYTSAMNLVVTRETGSSTLVICNSTSSGFSGVMSCNTSAYTGLKRAVVYRSASPPVVIAQKLVSKLNTTFNSSFGLFISVFLWLAIVLSGFGNNPIWTIILAVVGLIPSLIMGSINITIFTGIAVLGALIIHFIKRAVAQ